MIKGEQKLFDSPGRAGGLLGATLREKLLRDLKAGVNETFASSLKAKVSERVVPFHPGTHLCALVVALGVKGRRDTHLSWSGTKSIPRERRAITWNSSDSKKRSARTGEDL